VAASGGREGFGRASAKGKQKDSEQGTNSGTCPEKVTGTFMEEGRET